MAWGNDPGNNRAIGAAQRRLRSKPSSSARLPLRMLGITVLCFAASYAVALALEIAGLWIRFGWHRVAMVVMAVAGLVAHTLYLGMHALQGSETLGSAADWYLVVAWVLAATYLSVVFSRPGSAMGLFVLPLVLGLIAVSRWASSEPLAMNEGFHFWSRLHGGLLVAATVTVCLGSLSGLMYLIQSWRLKHKVPPSPRFRLPSLEWLEQVNSRSLGISAILVAGGVISGIVLARLVHRGDADYRLLGDPVVLSLVVMLVWLLLAEMFRVVYPAARRGRKVAYLTLASFGFLVIALVSLAASGTHGGPSKRLSPQPDVSLRAAPVASSASQPRLPSTGRAPA